MKYYLYIIKTIDNTLYCGITTDIIKRFQKHLEGKGAKYTKSHPPESIVYLDIFDDRNSASSEEYRIKKKLNRKQKLELIRQNAQKTKNISDVIGFDAVNFDFLNY